MWWMPWRRQAMKDVAACDKPRGAGKRALIRGCPNGETRPARVIPVRIHRVGEAHLLNGNISVGKETKINGDSESSGERNRTSLRVLAVSLVEQSGKSGHSG